VNAIRYKKRILHPAEASVSYIPEEVITNKLVKFLGILLTISLLALPLVACAKPLTLTVKAPMDGATVTTPSVTVKGNVSTYKATVTVNEAKVNVRLVWRKEYQASVARKTSYFERAVTLIGGENRIKVVATLGDEVVTKTITVYYPPFE